MTREVTYRRNAQGEYLDLVRGTILMQRIHLESMEPEQKAEVFHLSRQWQLQREPQTPAHTSARHKARFIEDMQLSHKIAVYAEELTGRKQSKRS